MLLLVGYVHESETIIVRLFQRSNDCYFEYYFIHMLIVLN